jgi:hypothetical protein
MGAEMGIDYDDFLDLSWGNFSYLQQGYMRRLERNWDYVRTIISSLFNSSGFSKKKVSPKDVMRLSFDVEKKITRDLVNEVDDEFIKRALKKIDENASK